MPDLSDLVPFHTGQDEVEQVQMHKVNTVLYFIFDYVALKTVDPGQLASSKAS